MKEQCQREHRAGAGTFLFHSSHHHSNKGQQGSGWSVSVGQWGLASASGLDKPRLPNGLGIWGAECGVPSNCSNAMPVIGWNARFPATLLPQAQLPVSSILAM
jgi:hypothetical protein